MKSVTVRLLVYVVVLPALIFPYPIVSQAADCNYANDKFLAGQKAACSTKPGSKWDCKTNRCLKDPNYKPLATDENMKRCEVKQAQENEGGSDVIQKGAVFVPNNGNPTVKKNGVTYDQKCLVQNAQGITGVKPGDDKQNLAASGTIAAISTLSAVVAIGTMGETNNTCAAISHGLLVGAGVVNGLGELVLYWQYGEKTKKVAKKYKKQIQSQEGLIDAQEKALEYIEKDQKTIAKLLDIRSKAYFLSAGLYAGAAIAAAAEMIASPVKPGDTCGPAAEATPAAGPAPAGGPPAGGPGTTAPPAVPAQKSNKWELFKLQRTLTYHSPKSMERDLESLQIQLSNTKESYHSLLLFNEYQDYFNGSYHSASLKQFEEYKKSNSTLDSVQIKNDDLKELLSLAIELSIKFKDQIIPNAYANADLGIMAGVTIGPAAIMGVVLALSQTARKKISTTIMTPLGRLILSGVMASINGVLGAHALSEGEKAEKNAKKVAALREQFHREHDALFDCRLEANKQKPECFCYTKDKQIDPTKSKNVICVNFFGRKRNLTAGIYEDEENLIGKKACVFNTTGQVDVNCTCQKQIGKDGKNTCFKSKGSTFSGNLGASKFIPSLSAASEAVASGKASLADVNGAAIKNAAFNARKIAKEQLEKTNPKFAPLLDPDSALTKKAVQGLLKDIPQKLIDERSKAGMDGSLAVAAPADLGAGQSAIRDAAAKAGLGVNTLEYNLPSPAAKAAPSGGNANDFFNNLGSDSAQHVQDGQVVGEFMDKNYDYKANDINQVPETPIWRVLSHRYQQSALPRLFADEELAAPNKEPKAGPKAEPARENAADQNSVETAP